MCLAEIHQLRFVLLFYMFTCDDDLAFGRLFKPGHHIQKCRLSRTRGTYYTAELAFAYGKIHSVERPYLVGTYHIYLVKILYLYYRFFHDVLPNYTNILLYLVFFATKNTLYTHSCIKASYNSVRIHYEFITTHKKTLSLNA